MKNGLRKFDGRTLWALLGVFVAVALFSFLVQSVQKPVDAANFSKFDPGYIISDYQMRNYASMSEAEIQAFLNSKVKCNKDQNYYNYLLSRYPGYSWHFANGHVVCLPEEKFGNGETIGSGETAAHIIWQAAQDYRINPQVLIVLLQKEQGLITDAYPNTVQYRSATGYGCPDTAPCSSQYYGFKNQVRKAAALFNTVLSGGWTNYPLGNNYIQYNPNSDCGGSWVNVKNLATSALYRYTPYQPNAGALAAGYGTSYCGAYGNRNFYAYFEDWFGGVTSSSTINAYYKSIGGEKSALGKAVASEVCGLTNGGCYREYKNGRLYWSEKKGVIEVSGGILYIYMKKSANDGPLGCPISGEKKGKNGIVYQEFEHGNIYWTEKTGSWDVSGGIYYKYIEQGVERGPLGYPTSGEKTKSNGIVYQEFEHGNIYWSSSNGTWIETTGQNRNTN